ncbi:hypothetical protein ABFV99_00555 [Cytobacillus horneckiae]|uniref:hypothetical protein n=1 Tax=Cytobacillus horneckiae TaxID=549687 RepID=UPI0034CFD9A8
MLDWYRKELEALIEEDDDIQEVVNNNILEVMEVLSKQGHSGYSIGYVRDILYRLLSYKPLTPLTGEEDEWEDVTELNDGVNMQQNKRCSTVFRHNNDNSTAYYIEARVFSDDGGESWFTNGNSHSEITFPFNVPDEPERIILGESE